jgi:hypothetical protein
MDTSPRSDSVWFIVAMVAAALGGIIAIAAIAAPADTTQTATITRTTSSPR